MNVNIYYIKDYQILSRWRGKKTNPIQTQSNPVLSAPVLSKVEGVEWANFKRNDGFSPQGIPGTAHYTRDCHGPQLITLQEKAT
jgi:hypothetical protein